MNIIIIIIALMLICAILDVIKPITRETSYSIDDIDDDDDYDYDEPTIIEREIVVYKKPELSSWEKRKLKKKLEKAARERDLDNMLEAMAMLDDDEDW